MKLNEMVFDFFSRHRWSGSGELLSRVKDTRVMYSRDRVGELSLESNSMISTSDPLYSKKQTLNNFFLD